MNSASILLSLPSTTLAPLHVTHASRSRSERTHTTHSDSRSGSATKEDNPNPNPCECLVLKNAWRASGRLPESTLYGIINKLMEGDNIPSLWCVAEFLDGGDVMIGEDALQDIPTTSDIKGGAVNQRVVMRVSNHRRFVEGAESNPHNPTLHRVVLGTRGKSMVSYTSFTELLNAAECAAEGMRATLPQ